MQPGCDFPLDHFPKKMGSSVWTPKTETWNTRKTYVSLQWIENLRPSSSNQVAGCEAQTKTLKGTVNFHCPASVDSQALARELVTKQLASKHTPSWRWQQALLEISTLAASKACSQLAGNQRACNKFVASRLQNWWPPTHGTETIDWWEQALKTQQSATAIARRCMEFPAMLPRTWR